MFIALICGMLVGGAIAGGVLIGGTFLAGSVLTGCGNSLDISSSATTSLADAGNPEEANLPQSLHLTMEDSGQTFVIRKGGIVEIVLPANPSSGWFWEMVEPDPEVSLLEQVGEPVYHAGGTSEGGTAAAGSSATRGGSSGDDSSSTRDSSSSTSNTSTTAISATSAEPTPTGTYTFTLRAVDAGETPIKLIYLPPDVVGDPTRTFSIVLQVK